MASLLQRVSSQAKLVSSKSKSHLMPALATCSQQRNLSVHEHVSMSLLQVSRCTLPFFSYALRLASLLLMALFCIGYRVFTI